MDLWYRIFAARDVLPDAAGVAACLADAGIAATIAWSASTQGWYRAEIAVGAGPSLMLERWLAEEEGIRAELNTWAAYLETCEDSPHHQAFMERAIQARQLFTLRRPGEVDDEAMVEKVCIALSRHLARVTEGFYQADERGFFGADGTLLVREE